MTSHSEGWKSKWFLASLIIIAIFINIHFSGGDRPQTLYREEVASARTPEPVAMVHREPAKLEPVRDEAKERAEAARKVAEWKQAQIDRYLTAGEYSRKPGVKQVAIAVSKDTGGYHRGLTKLLSTSLKTNSVEFLPALFQPEFLSDGLFARAWEGASNPIDLLDLQTFLDAIVLGRERVKYTVNPPSLANVITANLELEVTMMRVKNPKDAQTYTYSTVGVGFQNDAARAMAEEKLMKQLAGDTKMSLAELFSEPEK